MTNIRYHGGPTASVIRRQRNIIRRLYVLIVVLAVALAALWLATSADHKRDLAEIERLSGANTSLKIENDQLHKANKEIGAERDEAVKWLESIQPGINFDGL